MRSTAAATSGSCLLSHSSRLRVGTPERMRRKTFSARRRERWNMVGESVGGEVESSGKAVDVQIPAMNAR